MSQDQPVNSMVHALYFVPVFVGAVTVVDAAMRLPAKNEKEGRKGNATDDDGERGGGRERADLVNERTDGWTSGLPRTS